MEMRSYGNGESLNQCQKGLFVFAAERYGESVDSLFVLFYLFCLNIYDAGFNCVNRDEKERHNAGT